MITRVEIRNFQSHEHTVLDLSSGVNVLVGRSDAGKTAVLRAIRWVLTNEPAGLGFRSWSAGKEPVSVILTLSSGDTIERFRTKSKNLYRINGEDVTAPKRSVPEPVAKLLNVGPLNMQGQFDGVFLLNSSAGQVARYLNSIVNLEDMDEAIRAIKSRVRQTQVSLDNTFEAVEEEQEKLREFRGLDELAGRADALEQIEGQLRQAWGQRQKISKVVDRLVALEAEEIPDAKPFRRRLEKLEEQQKAIETLERQRDALEAPLNALARESDAKARVKTDLRHARDRLRKAMPKVCPLCEQEVK